MNQFQDLSELESSDDAPDGDTLNAMIPPKVDVDGDGCSAFVHPKVPSNNHREFDLSQFQDLSLLESSDDDDDDDNGSSNVIPNGVSSDDPNPKNTVNVSSKTPPPVPSTTASATKLIHSKAALRNMQSMKAQKSKKVKDRVIGAISNKKAATEQFTKEIVPDPKLKEKEANSDCRDSERMRKRKRWRQSEEEKEERVSDSECPWRRVLVFAVHLHLTGCVLPKWVHDVVTLFADSEQRGCAEAASLGRHHRKLFLDTICRCSEPDHFIFVDTDESIEEVLEFKDGDVVERERQFPRRNMSVIAKNVGVIESKYSNCAVVEVDADTLKYSELRSVGGHVESTCAVQSNHLVLSRGRYLFFNKEYKRKFIDYFLGSDSESISKIPFCCKEYKSSQRVHLRKILKLDYGLEDRFGEWFLTEYDRAVGALDINDCYESLTANLKEWIPLLIDWKAIRIQQDVDRTFTIKTDFDGIWVHDMEREQCSMTRCTVKFGVIQRKHHCRSCGDIFCKLHCEKVRVRRNEGLELDMGPTLSADDDDDEFWNKESERDLRMCPKCRETKSLFVDRAHRHKFMDCKCLMMKLDVDAMREQWHLDRERMKLQNE